MNSHTSNIWFDGEGNTPLHIALKKGTQPQDFNSLVQRFHMMINYQNKQGETPLSLAIMDGRFNVDLLLEYGANPNVPNLRSESPLHLAVCLGSVDICNDLIKFGAWLDAVDDDGDTALHWAVREEKINIVEMLLRKGADLYKENDDGENSVMLAKMVGSRDIIEVFDLYICESEMDTYTDSLTVSQSWDDLYRSIYNSSSLDLSQDCLFTGEMDTSM